MSWVLVTRFLLGQKTNEDYIRTRPYQHIPQLNSYSFGRSFPSGLFQGQIWMPNHPKAQPILTPNFLLYSNISRISFQFLWEF